MKRIGKYRILGLLGRGGMGVVHKAMLPVAERVVAVKLLRPTDILLDVAGKDALVEQFLREVRTMAGFEHPNLAQVLDCDWHEGWPFMVMGYHCMNLGLAIGESYRVEARSRRLRVDKAVDYALQTLEGLRRLHHAGVIHRDVKPYNLLLTRDDRVQIIDFGLSRLRGETSGAPRGVKVGSPFYAAPEQEADPESADQRADLFSWAVTLHRMLTGCLPACVLDDADDAGDADANGVAAAVGPESAPEWDAFFDQAMARDPKDRFQNAEEAGVALKNLHRRFQKRLEAVCQLPEEEPPAPPPANARSEAAPALERPRSEPRKVRQSEAAEVFGLDELARPLPRFFAHIPPQALTLAPPQSLAQGLLQTLPHALPQALAQDLPQDLARPRRQAFAQTLVQPARKLEASALTVRDPATGLVWERSGSTYPMTWPEARESVERLDREGFAGHKGWRLPTLNELATLATPADGPRSFCLEEVFDPTQAILWSADRKSFVSAWFLHAALGFVGAQDFTCHFWRRAVRSE